MPTKTELPLSPADIKKLRSSLMPILFIPLFFGGFIYFISGKVLGQGGLSGDGIFTFVFGAFGLIFLAIIGYMLWSYVSDIRGAVKERIEGTVTDKRLDIQTSGGHGTGPNRSRTRTSRHHYVYLDGEEFKIDYKHYSGVKVGEHIVMERAPKSNVIFALEVLETGSEEEQEQVDKVDHKFLSTKMVEKRFSTEDLSALRRVFITDRNRKFVFMLPLLFIAGGLIATEMGALLIFLFPIPLILLFQFIGLCRLFLRYSKDKAYGHKKGFTALLEDKLTITGNRRQNKHTLHTTRGRYTVSTPIYDALSTGDKLVIYMPKYGKKPLSIATLNGEEFYLL